MFSDGGNSGRGTDMNPLVLMMLAGGGNGFFKDMFDGAFELDDEGPDDGKEKEV